MKVKDNLYLKNAIRDYTKNAQDQARIAQEVLRRQDYKNHINYILTIKYG